MMTNKTDKKLEAFDNPYANRDYQIHMEIPEFTCLNVSKTGQPDFAKLVLDYIPAQKMCRTKAKTVYMVVS